MRAIVMAIGAALVALKAPFALGAVGSHPIQAQTTETTFSVDLTGLWYNPLESGWGVNIIQQSQTLFATLFVYDSNGKPLWLVGSDVSYTGPDSSGAFIFSGALFQTNGPWFGSGFNPASVGAVQVGTITFRFPTYTTAQVTYSVNGLSVTKNVVPQTWHVNNLTGTYFGTVFGANANCGLPLQAAANVLAFHITQAGTLASINVVDVTNTQCNLTGTITQYGKIADIDGSYVCSNGATGLFGIRRLEAGIDGLTGAFLSVNVPGCSGAVATIGAARVQ